MTKYRKILSLFLAILTVFSLFPMTIGAEETSVEPEWPNEGAVLLNKTAAAVPGEDNMWEVTLTVEGKNYKTTSDVVLVIDCSRSMLGTKLNNTRTAAKAFGEKLLASGSSTRIAIVTYASEASAYNDGHFYTSTELNEFKAAVDAATYASGGTNQQLGLHIARELLSSDASTGNLKNIVILSDGEPTYSYKFQLTGIYENCDRISDWGCSNLRPSGGTLQVQSVSVDYTHRLGSGGSTSSEELGDSNASIVLTCTKHDITNTYNVTYNLDGAVTGFGVLDTDRWNVEHGVATIWEANQAKADGVTVYSVALQAGTNGEATLKSCATDAATDYYEIASDETDVESKLTSAFERIAGSIAIAASNAVATDTMGEHVQLTFSGAAPVITTDEAVYNSGAADLYISQGSAAFDETTQTISWTVGNVREGDTPTMKYKVTIKDGYHPDTGDVIYTNQSATLTYENYKGEEVAKPFPKPAVTVGGGTILVHWYMVNGDGEPINTAGVVVEGPAYAKQVQTADYFTVDGTSGLKYNTAYSVPCETFADYTYYGSYIINDGALETGNVANITLTAANANQDVWFAYTQGFRVGHVQYDESTEDVTITYTNHIVEGDFDLTAQTTTGYLYGGAFSDEDCESVQTFNADENATSFLPEAGATYYIWEVDEKYLVPKSIDCWEHNADGLVDVMGFFITTPIDREYYAEVGFCVNSNDIVANQVSETYVNNDAEVLVAIGTTDESVVYEEVRITRKDGGESVITTGTFDINRGYLAVVSLAKESYWADAEDTVTFTPYWITLDGVKVTSATTRVSTYNGAGPDVDDDGKWSKTYRMLPAKDTTTSGKLEYVGTEDGGEILAVYASFFGGVTANETAVPEEPTTPVQPADPEEPVDPDKETVEVFVYDNGEMWSLNCVAESDISDEIVYRGMDGYLFAGWYEDESFETPADLTCAFDGMEVYAKYVSDAYLQVKYTEVGFFSRRSLTLYTAADSNEYQEVGFIINGEYISGSSYRYGSSLIFGREVPRNSMLYAYTMSLSRLATGDTLEIVPYWITLDGTMVKGTPRTLTMSRYGIQG